MRFRFGKACRLERIIVDVFDFSADINKNNTTITETIMRPFVAVGYTAYNVQHWLSEKLPVCADVQEKCCGGFTAAEREDILVSCS